MQKIIKKKLLFIGILFSFLVFQAGLFSTAVSAADTTSQQTQSNSYKVFSDASTNYGAYIDDGAGLLTNEEKTKLTEVMKELTPYTGVAFVTTNTNPGSVESYAKEKSAQLFGSGNNSTMFLIDMDNRKIYIYSAGNTYKIINKDKANVITDNVYAYARDGEYYQCASEAFRQEAKVLSGGKIAQPMKYISNGIISVIAGSIICFIIIKAVHRQSAKQGASVLGSENTHLEVSNVNEVYKGSRRVDHNVEAGVIAGSIIGGMGGSGGGGGGSSGGGGGHSF